MNGKMITPSMQALVNSFWQAKCDHDFMQDGQTVGDCVKCGISAKTIHEREVFKLRLQLRDIDHDCHASPEDGCAVCTAIMGASEPEIYRLAQKQGLTGMQDFIDQETAYESLSDWQKEQSGH